jgi:beta propeller repeat protein
VKRQKSSAISLIALLCLLCTLALGTARPAGAAPTLTAKVSVPVVLAGGPGIQKQASMAGNLMVYTSCVAGNCDVLALDLTTGKVTPISAHPWDEEQPNTDGQRVVWQDGRSTSDKDTSNLLDDFDIYGANLNDLKPYQLTGAPHQQNHPQVWGNIAVWADFRDAQSPQDQQAGNIYLYDIPGHKETAIATARSAQVRPVTNGSVVVWVDYRNEPDPNGTNSDIYAYDIATGQEFPITTAPGTQTDPAISGNIVVWADYRNGPDDADIYGYDLTTKQEFQITNAPGSQVRPAIWGNLVVWTDFRNEPDKVNGTNSDIYGYDLTTKQEFPIYVGPGRQDNPKTASGVVSWEDSSKGNSDVDIMGATVSGIALTPPPAPPPLLPGSGSRFFPETKQTVTGIFLDYWNNNGGLPQQGFPISPVMTETSDLDHKTYTVQYFERAVFEYHPENPPQSQVLLSQLGTFRLKARYPNGPPAAIPSADPNTQVFTETGFTVSGRFLDYWQSHGGLAQQGYPISGVFTETSDLDGKPYTVQYFERAVFEMHPEKPPPYDVLLSQLGTFRYKQKYGTP